MLVESITPHERHHLLDVAVGTQLFNLDEAESLLGGVLDGLAASTLPEGHQAAGCRIHQDGDAVGWCYSAPDDPAAGVWNLWWIGVAPRHHGSGAGRAMLAYVEKRVIAAGGRLLVVETSDADALARGRIFSARPTIRKEKNLYEES